MTELTNIPLHRRALPPYGITIFLSAFLLFQVQLILGKYFLPWFGGTPAMWTTCMFFFQTLLLAGYLYSHAVTSLLSFRTQRQLHATALLAALAAVIIPAVAWHSPLLPGSNWKPRGPENPTWHLAILLAISAGLPYLMLATNGPLLQRWFSMSHPGVSPYRLYSLSNLGSFLALLSYPFIVEPWFSLRTQGWLWSVGFLVYVVFCGYCVFRLRGNAVHALDFPGEEAHEPVFAVQPGIGDYLYWLGLAGCGSLLFLATTNEICQNIAVVPMLWIGPLSIYLLSFVICFNRPDWYSRPIFLPALAVSILIAIFLLNGGALTRLTVQIACYSLILFVACMVCHGELARSKPVPKYLTSFYFMISAGGALAGVFVSLIAPRVFTSFWEYPIALWMTVLFTFLALARDNRSWLYGSKLGLPIIAICTTLLPGIATLATTGKIGLDYLLLAAVVVIAVYVVVRGSKTGFDRARAQAVPWFAAVALLVLGSVLFLVVRAPIQGAVFMVRNFYGILTVGEVNQDDPEWRAYSLSNGRIRHGIQFRSQPYSALPTSYFGVTSGVGQAIATLRAHSSPGEAHPGNLRIGVIGLGIGTLAAYAQPGDYFRFYEINPDVIRIAADENYFTYLADSPAKPDIVAGDARLSIEREVRGGSSERFNLLVLDAFSGDAVPFHLLTKEAFQLYLQQLGPEGIIAAHITNTYLDLEPVLLGVAQDLRLKYVFVHSNGDGRVTMYNDWVLLSKGSVLRPLGGEVTGHVTGRVWTDEYSNLFQVLR
jgi:hypothetical protein